MLCIFHSLLVPGVLSRCEQWNQKSHTEEGKVEHCSRLDNWDHVLLYFTCCCNKKEPFDSRNYFCAPFVSNQAVKLLISLQKKLSWNYGKNDISCHILVSCSSPQFVSVWYTHPMFLSFHSNNYGDIWRHL